MGVSLKGFWGSPARSRRCSFDEPRFRTRRFGQPLRVAPRVVIHQRDQLATKGTDNRDTPSGCVHTGVTHLEHSSEKVISMGHATTATLTATAAKLGALGLTTGGLGRADVQGERFQSAARLVVAPAAVVFEPVGDLRPGREIQVGQVVGHLNSGQSRTPIVSPFAGQSGEALAWSGERLVSHQPVMWLSTEAGTP